ncbi:unnamed protein product [Schistosoma bovis]|nr:unnamed protein product [Schistosoma bovis]CAH8627984.1 unnamed protein product [Schistosoma bovis]
MTYRVSGLLQRSGKILKGCYYGTLKLAVDGSIKRAKPPNYDFFSSGNNYLRFLFDNTKTMDRFNDNSKVIVVEGNIASGKSNVAAKLAKYLDMEYFPDPTEDDIYVYRNVEPNFDIRCHNFLLPDYAKYYTCEMFWNEPDLINKGKGLYLQYHFYLRRYWNYLRALCHLFNTGQGVVIDRSPFSEFIFAEAMHKCNYLSERGLLWFKQNHTMTINNLWKPHLLVYIKAPIKQIREKIKKRNIPWEVNARNLTDEFLNAYEDLLGNYYIENMDRYSHILTVDGSTVDVYDDDDIYIIAQNATEIDLSGQYLMRDDYKLLEWRLALRYASSLINSRLDFSNAHEKFTRVFDQVEFPMDLNELTYTYEAQELQGAAIHMDPRTCIPPAYNPKYKSILEIMFNPWIIKTNFRADLPKNYIWN